MPDLLARAGMVPVRHGHLLPLRPVGSVPIGTAAALLETEDGGVVSVWGMVQSLWLPGDVIGRRLGAVMLSMSDAASKSDIAAGFGVDSTTLRDWVIDFEHGGLEALAPGRRGPKGPSKLTAELAVTIRSLRAKGATLLSIAETTGVSTDTVRRALAASGAGEVRPTARSVAAPPATSTELVPLARPLDRSPERALARFGLLQGAEPVICEGASLPFAGSLIVLPVLLVTGLLGALDEVYGSARSAFYSLRSLALSLVFSALLGECRVEGLSRIDPVAIGRLIGLDRAPEVGTMRRRMEELAELRRSSELLTALARAHVVAHPEAMGILYIDGHVRAYHGGADLPRAHLARARIAMAATTDSWLTDERGDALLVWSSAPGASLTGELKLAATQVRELLGPDAHPTIGFDRGGYSPACFAELSRLGFDILTYRKAPFPAEPRGSFSPYVVKDGFGHEQTYFLSERNVRLPYDKKRRYFACRQVTRLDEESGHQTPVLTTWPAERPSAEVATSMFHRWREENMFRFMRPRGLDAMDSYAKVDDDPTRLVPNRAKKAAKTELSKATASLAKAEEAEGRLALSGDDAGTAEVRAAYDEAVAAVAEMRAAYRAIPAKITLGEARSHQTRLDDERKRLHDAIRMAAFNAESALARALGPHYRRAEDEAHSLLAEAFKVSGDVEVIGDECHVRLDPLSAPRRSRAIAALCAELSETETPYPGTNLRLVFSVKGCC